MISRAFLFSYIDILAQFDRRVFRAAKYFVRERIKHRPMKRNLWRGFKPRLNLEFKRVYSPGIYLQFSDPWKDQRAFHGDSYFDVSTSIAYTVPLWGNLLFDDETRFMKTRTKRKRDIQDTATLVVLRSSRGYKRKHHLLLVYYFDPFSSLPGSFRHSIFNYFYFAFFLCPTSSITSIWNTRTFDVVDETFVIQIFLLFHDFKHGYVLNRDKIFILL